MSTPEQRFNERLSGKSRNYDRNMRAALKHFLGRYGLTADELYERQRQIEKGVALGEMEAYELDWLPNLVQVLIAERVQQGQNPEYAKDTHKAVSLFCRVNHLRYEQTSHDLPQADNVGKGAFTRSHIAKMWDHAEGLFKTRNRAIMAALKDSGLRPVDMAKLTVRDYRQAVKNSPTEGYAVFNPIVTGKKGTKAHPHLGPDAVAAIGEYLGDTKLREYLGVTDNGPLFMAREMDGKNGGLLGFKAMNSMDISIVVKRIIEAAGINNGSRYGAYSFRKYHMSRLNSATEDLELPAMQLSYIYKLEGRRVKDSVGTYDRPEESGDLTREYVRHYPKLSMTGDTGATSERVQSLEARLGERDDRVQRLEAQLEDREARLFHVEQKLDVVMRALANPETAPVLMNALREIEEKAKKARRGQA